MSYEEQLFPSIPKAYALDVFTQLSSFLSITRSLYEADGSDYKIPV